MISYATRIAVVIALAGAWLPVFNVSANPIGDPAFDRTWERTDRPVAEGSVDRTWMWGPSGHTDAMMEDYAEAPNGQRLVQYFDKTRMEINDPDADPESVWYVTNGLLAQELVTGEMQTGNEQFQQRVPADVQLAGDAHPDSPTYAMFNEVLDHEPLPADSLITQSLEQDGSIGSDENLANYRVTAAHFVEDTNHTVASVFWEFMNSSGAVYVDNQIAEDRLFENPFFAVGFPITEAYWVHVPVAGEWQDVLVQCFERRCLTFTPGNDEGWQVEAGNIGQHYYQWRYEDDPPLAPDPPDDPSGDPGYGARENPVPMGSPANLADGWEVTILDVTPNATQQVLNENQFNDPPEEGHQFFIAENRATYHGDDSDNFSGSYRLRTVGHEGVSYSTFSDSCGVIPNDLQNPEVFTGGSFSGNVCWQIRSADADSLVMFDNDQDDSERVYMALHGDSVTADPPPSPQPPEGTDLGSRGNPIPMGTPVELDDGWEVTVLDVTPNATQQVMDENQFNDPPESGHQFFIANVQATYHGEGSDNFSGSYRLRSVGAESVTYSTFSNSCGVIPDRLGNSEVFTGGSISGNVCWQIRSTDADTIVMFDSSQEDSNRVYMALH